MAGVFDKWTRGWEMGTQRIEALRSRIERLQEIEREKQEKEFLRQRDDVSKWATDFNRRVRATSEQEKELERQWGTLFQTPLPDPVDQESDEDWEKLGSQLRMRTISPKAVKNHFIFKYGDYLGKSLQRETEVSQTLPPEAVASVAGETKPTKEVTTEPSTPSQPPTPKPFDVNSALDARIALYYRSRSREEASKAYGDDWDRMGILNAGKGDDRLKESIARQMHETRIELGDIPENTPFEIDPYLTIKPALPPGVQTAYANLRGRLITQAQTTWSSTRGAWQTPEARANFGKAQADSINQTLAAAGIPSDVTEQDVLATLPLPTEPEKAKLEDVKATTEAREATTAKTKAQMALIEQQVKWYAPIAQKRIALMNAQSFAATQRGKAAGKGGGSSLAAAGLALRQAALKVGIVKASVDDLYNLQTMAQSYRLSASDPKYKGVVADSLNNAAGIFEARAAMMENQLQSMGQAGPQIQGQPGGTVSVNIGGAQYVIPTGTGLPPAPQRRVSKFKASTEQWLMALASASTDSEKDFIKAILGHSKKTRTFNRAEIGKVYRAAKGRK